MKEVIDYKKVKKIFRHRVREVYIPIYRDIGHGASKPKQIKSKEK